MTLNELAQGYFELLTGITKGQVQCFHVGPSWDEVYAGDVRFTANGWNFTIFNDCDSLDYTDAVEAPDGSKATFDELFENKLDPVCFNPWHTEIYAKLEVALKRSTGVVPK